jgi:hypothetical protein
MLNIKLALTNEMFFGHSNKTETIKSNYDRVHGSCTCGQLR